MWVRGGINLQCFRGPILKAPTCSEYPPSSTLTLSPKDGFRKSRSFFFYRFLFCRSLTLSQRRDVEKDVKMSQETSSKPGSDHSLDVTDLSTKLQNPLAGKDRATLEADAVAFCERHDLMGYGAWRSPGFFRNPSLIPFDVVKDYKKGAVLAAFLHEAEKVEGLTEDELTALHNEKTNKWKQPWQVYYIAIISSMAAVVQGMEYVVFSFQQFLSA